MLRLLGSTSLAALAPPSYAAYLIQTFWLRLMAYLSWNTAFAPSSLFVVAASFLSGAAIHVFVEKPLAKVLASTVRVVDHCVSLQCCFCCGDGTRQDTGEGLQEA